jgi:hypothetical protein
MSGYQGNSTIAADPAVCNCKCNPATGQTCTVTGTADTVHTGTVDALLTGDAMCGGSPTCGANLEVPSNWTGSCYGPDYAPGGQKTCGLNGGATCTMGTSACNVQIFAQPLQLTGGSCTPNGQPATKPAITWAVAGEACGGAMPGTGCNNGAVCMPKPQAPFVTGGVCVMQTGDVACPPGAFVEKHLFYGGANDTRDCSACTCPGSASGGKCTGKIQIYSSATPNTCTGTLIATLMPTESGGDCANITGNPNASGRKATFTVTQSGTCTPGAMPIGIALPADPTTFCCIP